MIAAIGLDRTKAYIANVIPWRPPGNRTPTPQETQICLPFIQRQIELVNPDVLVTLGNPSTQTLLSTREGIMKTRGKWFDYDTGTRKINALATFHPAYLLRSPSYKRLAWQDLRAIAKALRPRMGKGALAPVPTIVVDQDESFGGHASNAPLPTLEGLPPHCALGRTMAQPIRSSPWRPVTSRRRRAGFPARCREIVWRVRPAACRRCRTRARPRRRRSR